MKQFGFICNFQWTCTKYDLVQFINTFKHSGQYPSLIAWKSIIYQNVNDCNHNTELAQTEQAEINLILTSWQFHLTV